MKYYIQIRPKDKPNGLYLLETIGRNKYTTTDIVENALCFENEKYDGLSPQNFSFILFGINIGLSSKKDNELVSDFIIKLVNEEEVAEIQELTTWKSTLVELPRNGECVAFRFTDSLDVIKKGYAIVFYDKSVQFNEVTMGAIGEFLPNNSYRKDKLTEVLWKPLIY